MRRRIAVFTPGGVTPEGRGVHISSLARVIAGLSEFFDITVFSLITFESDQESTSCGNARVVLVSARYDAHWLRKGFALARSFFAEHNRRPFDMTHGMLGVLPELTALLSARMVGIPCCVSLFGGETANLPAIKYGSLHSPILRFLTRWVVDGADAITVLTNFQRHELETLHFSPSFVSVIPHGIDPPAKREQKRVPSNPYRFLHVGSVTPVKDHETLLKAFSEIRQSADASLRIVGADYRNGFLEHRIRELQLEDSVTVVGYVSSSSLHVHYEWADALLHTSLHEGQAMVVVEAAAHQVLLAGTKVGLLCDFDDSIAVRVEVGDASGLARGVLEVLKDSSRVRDMRVRALTWSLENNADATVSRYRRVYESLLSTR